MRAFAPKEIRHAAIEAGGWVVQAASVIGPSHVLRKEPRQDEFAMAIEGPFCIAAVADGLGSAPLSQVGSALAVRETVLQLATLLKGADPKTQPVDTLRFPGFETPTQKRSWLSWLIGHRAPNPPPPPSIPLALKIEEVLLGIREELWKRAAQANTGSRDGLDTTILGVVLTKESGLFFHCGDGAGIAAEEVGRGQFETAVYSEPENGEFSNITFPLTLETAKAHIRCKPFQLKGPVFLMSDGAMPFAADSRAHGLQLRRNFLEPIDKHLASVPLAAGAEDLAKTLDSEDARASESDDKTLLVIRRAP
jgi:hypothetical protein